jgi:hypothetical protein
VNDEKHIEQVISGALLTAVDSVDVPSVRAHIAVCVDCRDRVLEMERALVVIPGDVVAVNPSPSVRAAVLAEADGDRRGERRSASWMFPGTAVAAVAVVATALVVGLLLWSLALSERLDDRDAQLIAARAAAGSFAQSAEMLHMESEFAGNAVNAAITVPASGTPITVVVTGLPHLDEGSGYRLWLFANGRPETSVALEADAHGNVVATLDVDLSQFDEMELDAQSVKATAPGGDLVLGGPLR